MSKSELTPLQQIKQSEKEVRAANQRRRQARSVLELSSLADMPPTLAEQALAQLNLNIREGGQITAADLRRFAQKVEQLRHDYRSHKISGGITPRSVIDRSRLEDLERCQDEIVSVLAVRQQADGVVVFRTNASGKYDAAYHMVTVQFLNFQAALNAARLNNQELDLVLRGAVKFDCDCGRHRFWYRYLATAGGFAYGTPETGFPKVRNPELTGLGCKHVLRVMHSLNSTTLFRQMMKNYLTRFRKNVNARQSTVTAKQAAEQQVEAVKGKQIRRRKGKASTPDEQAMAAAALKNANSSALNKVQLLYQQGLLSETEYQTMAAALRQAGKMG